MTRRKSTRAARIKKTEADRKRQAQYKRPHPIPDRLLRSEALKREIAEIERRIGAEEELADREFEVFD